MKTAWRVVLCSGILAISVWAAGTPENLVKNGDFSEGRKGWKGRGKSERLPDGNTCLVVDLSERRFRVISQRIRLDKTVKHLKVSFRCKMKKDERKDELLPAALWVHVGEQEPDEDDKKKKKKKKKKEKIYEYMQPFYPEGKDEWQEFSFPVEAIEEPRKLKHLSFKCETGLGRLYIDDVVVVPASEPPAKAAPEGKGGKKSKK